VGEEDFVCIINRPGKKFKPAYTANILENASEPNSEKREELFISKTGYAVWSKIALYHTYVQKCWSDTKVYAVTVISVVFRTRY